METYQDLLCNVDEITQQSLLSGQAYSTDTLTLLYRDGYYEIRNISSGSYLHRVKYFITCDIAIKSFLGGW
jgi:hypothetical protein